ncbi:hypothetical protein [Streptomonospora litoralis]|uniref:Uncharacterized protein n=1 Tax=Streptomonospora litoralis TaxID=2498135 RepID=A0A4P6Q8G8_9ACTN|nr:hypothetical protein [Streptomonospora litoralis]QBI56750.1 hypothetical protein EKD16_25045 [Streptomonospora litoralis]
MPLSDVPAPLRWALLSAGPRGVLRRPPGGTWEVTQTHQVRPGDEVHTQDDLVAAGGAALTAELHPARLARGGAR